MDVDGVTQAAGARVDGAREEPCVPVVGVNERDEPIKVLSATDHARLVAERQGGPDVTFAPDVARTRATVNVPRAPP